MLNMISTDLDMSPLITLGPSTARSHLILAHGAGAPMTSPFLETLSDGLAGHGVRISRFEFGYMAQRRNNGGKRPPPSMERLAGEYRALLTALPTTAGQRVFIGGKSMGGRVASLLADELFAAQTIAGLVCVGYPFHPPRKPASLRTAHLATLGCPSLIVQGERDPLGCRAEVMAYDLSPAIALHWLADGDHDLAPRRASGHTQAGHLTAAAAAIARFLDA